MSIKLSRNPNQPGASNTLRPGDGQFKYYEKTYASGTTQEWIYLPDCLSPIGVTVTPTGTTNVDITNSPPDLVEAGSAATTAWSAGSITGATTVTMQAITAFRINMSSGTVKVSVVC